MSSAAVAKTAKVAGLATLSVWRDTELFDEREQARARKTLTDDEMPAVKSSAPPLGCTCGHVGRSGSAYCGARSLPG